MRHNSVCRIFRQVDMLGEVTPLPAHLDLPLNRQILNDLEYGVSSRPSIPACFDDEDALSAGSVDDVTDLRYSPWDSAAQHCRFRPSDKPVTIGDEVGGIDPSSDSADASVDQK